MFYHPLSSFLPSFLPSLSLFSLSLSLLSLSLSLSLSLACFRFIFQIGACFMPRAGLWPWTCYLCFPSSWDCWHIRPRAVLVSSLFRFKKKTKNQADRVTQVTA
jgi:hypothetical protein